MKITVIPTMYRDASNWKVHGEIHLRGELTETLARSLRAALDDGMYYVPGQLGLTHYGAGEYSTFPGQDDHGWQEMALDESTVVDAAGVAGRVSVAAGPEDGGTVSEFVDAVVRASRAGWNPALHAA